MTICSGPAAGDRLRELRRGVSDDDDIAACDDVIDRVAQMAREMRDLLLDVLLVGADQPRQRHVAVVDAQLVPLAEQRLREDHHRRFAQVVGAGLEAEPEQADSLPTDVDDSIERVLDLQLVASEHRVDERHLQIDFAGAVLQRADVLRQARPAERESRLQVVRRQVQLLVRQKMSITSWLSTPIRLQRLPISFAKTTFTACHALLVYFIISATRMLVLYSGASTLS